MRSSRRLEPGSESKVRKSSARRVDDKVLFERLWKGTFQAIVAASLQARGGGHRKGTTLRSVISVKESHQMAEANQEKNLKMREALGISQYFVEGSSLDPARKAKEAAAAEEAKKKYALIPDSSSSSPERTQEKEKVKKRKKKKSGNNDEKLDSAKKKKSSKKHKKDRSVSPEHQKKKKSKKSSKDKLKHKSKKSRIRSSSSSSVVSSSSSADDESSSRSSSVSSITQSDGSSYERRKHSSKADRNLKSHKKRSLSPEDPRSRKDLYEAKKGKHKRKSGRSPTTSTSEDDSSPKQYYRLEPVLLKSKTKHKKTRQFIELPKKSTYELKKKKRVYDSSTSSSSSATKSKSRSKYRKRSSSPENSKASKYHFSRNEDSCKSSKRHSKTSCSPEEKIHKSKHKKSVSEDRSKISRRSKNKAYDDKNGRKYHKSSDKHLYKRTCSTSPEKSSTKKKQESPKKRKEGKKSPKHRHQLKDKNCSESPKVHRSHKASSESLFRSKERNSKSPNCHNGQSRSPSVVSGYSPGGPSSFSPFNEERFFTRSPSFPPKYKHKKHILNESPPYSSQTVSKSKISPKSSQKCTARAAISTSRSVSPDEFYLRKSKQRHSTSPQVANTKRASQKKKSPKSKTSSPEVDAKQRKVYGDKSRSSSASNSTPDETLWKSKSEMKVATLNSKNLSISPEESSRSSPLKVNTSPDRKSPTTNNSCNADVFQAVPNSVKRKLDDQQGTTEDVPNKMIKLSPARNRNSNSDNERIFFNLKSISVPHLPLEDKTAVEASEARENVNSSEKKASQKGGVLRKRSKTPELRATKEGSHSRSRSTSAAHSCSASDRSSSYSKSRSYSRSKSFSRSRSKSYSRSRSRSASLSSRSRSRSYSSRSRSRSIARSPSIPRRRGSPSFLDKRRITSARKRPVPYRRPSPPTPSSSEEGSSSWSYRSVTPSSASSPRSYNNSPIQAATPFIHSFDNRV